jgi:GDP-L-fucose synthase
MNKSDRIYVAGHGGLVGGAIVRRLQAEGYENVLTAARSALDLRRQREVEDFFAAERPAYVFLSAAKVGGIHANSTYPADFIRDNLQIQTNIIDAAWRNGTSKLLFLGSSCIYPRLAPQPMPESALLTGPFEPTNEWYAIAKVAGIKLCQAYRRQYGFNAIAAMPTNLYGPGDNFSAQDSHVLPALLRRFHEARENAQSEVIVWGTGTPRREFLYVDDLADAAIFLMRKFDGEDLVNVGWGEDVSIRELAETIAEIVGWHGNLIFDAQRPDGMPRKLLDVSKMRALGWNARVRLREGITSTYEWFVANHAMARM